MICWMRRRLAPSDGGVETGNAILIALFVGMIVTGLGATSAYMAVNNTQNADRDRQGAMALDVADAGVAAATEYLRTGSPTITCPESSISWSGTTWTTSSPSLCSGAWNGPSGSQAVSVQGMTYNVWISQVQKATPPTTRESVYKVRSEGVSGSAAPGRRSVETTLVARPFNYPVGVYAESMQAAGTADVFQQTLFSTGCINGQKLLDISGDDLWYGGKAGVRTTDGVTAQPNGSCSQSQDVLQAPSYCNSSFPVLDKFGGTTASPSSCFGLTTTKFTMSDLESSFGLTPRGLQPQQYAALRAIAVNQQSYYTSTTGWTAPDPAIYPNAVLYFKLDGGTLNIQNQLNVYGMSTCGQRSIVIIVEGGSVHLNAQSNIVGALFAPDGNLGGNGGATFTGTIFAKTLDKFNGNAQFQMDQCWLDNFPALSDIQVTDYRQIDR